jgi:hypothetical protein
MTDIYQKPDQTTPQNPVVNSTPPPVQQKGQIDWKLIPSKIKPILAAMFTKFYSHKKIFWPVSISLGLVFLIVVLGLAFGNRNQNKTVSSLPTPTPTIQPTPEATVSGGILLDNFLKLKELKKEIVDLDIHQSRLQLPTLDFDSKF